jgi:hypothetical protein
MRLVECSFCDEAVIPGFLKPFWLANASITAYSVTLKLCRSKVKNLSLA